MNDTLAYIEHRCSSISRIPVKNFTNVRNTEEIVSLVYIVVKPAIFCQIMVRRFWRSTKVPKLPLQTYRSFFWSNMHKRFIALSFAYRRDVINRLRIAENDRIINLLIL